MILKLFEKNKQKKINTFVGKLRVNLLLLLLLLGEILMTVLVLYFKNLNTN